jgi:hypothetical protein
VSYFDGGPTRLEALRELLSKAKAERLREGDFCYTDHQTGDVDHMNAHIRTSDCARRFKGAGR